MKFHNNLNNKLWDGFELKPEVKEKLNEIAKAFEEYLDIPQEAILDVRITGSSASYNYTKYSDLDLHLIVDYEKVHEDCPIVEGYLWSYKSAFNRDHDISIYGINVEVYAENSNDEAISNGVYSLTEDKWLKKPEKIEPTDNDEAVFAKYSELKEASDRVDDSEVAQELLDKIYKMRKAGLDEVGEFSTENMAFKLLRNDGIIDNLKEIKKQKVDKELSLESLQQLNRKLNKMYEDYKKSKYSTEWQKEENGKLVIIKARRDDGFSVTIWGSDGKERLAYFTVEGNDKEIAMKKANEKLNELNKDLSTLEKKMDESRVKTVLQNDFAELTSTKVKTIYDKLNESLYEALELNVVKDGNLTLPIDELVIRSYDVITGYVGRARKPMTDWVTEYNYVSKNNLSKQEFDKIIEESGNTPYGQITYQKKKLTYGNNEVYYRHICKAVMY